MAAMRWRARGSAALLVLGLLLTACSGGDPEPPAAATTTVPATGGTSTTTAPSTTAAAAAGTASSAQFRAARVRLVRVAMLEQPVAMAVRPGERTLYLVEQVGRVRAVRGGRLDPTPVVDISAQVTAGGEQGLLGLAFSPDGRYLYLHYTDRAGDHQISELTMSGGRADPGSQRSVLRIDDPFGNHNGGQLAFGPDRRLYIGFGDGGGGGDPQGNGQSLGASPPTTRSSIVTAPAPRSGTTDCATRGASRSILRPATCGSATSARTPGRRSTASPPARGAATTAGTGARAATRTRAASDRRAPSTR